METKTILIIGILATLSLILVGQAQDTCWRTTADLKGWDSCKGKVAGKLYKSCSVCYKDTTGKTVHPYDYFSCANCGGPELCMIPKNCAGTPKVVENVDGKYDVYNYFNPNSGMCNNPAPSPPIPDPNTQCV